MARGGINKALVMRAQQALLARGEHPSIDAVRVELGNTGSKTTIHRYLKELEESEAERAGNAAGLSDELAALIAPLAARLQEEAEETVARMRQQCEVERAEFEARQARAQERIQHLEEQVGSLTASLQAETEHHRHSREQWQLAEIDRARLLQANQDQAAHLKDRDEQVRSLEEKHRHGREALEHYRQASKEQREQEQRRHEAQLQQVQMELRQLQQSLILKQDEVTRLNRANERLASESLHKDKELDGQRDRLERQAGELAALHDRMTQSHAAREVLQERLGLSRAETDGLKAALDAQRQEAQRLHIDLAAAGTELQLLRQVLADERERARPTSPEPEKS
ncbi:cointegrate resolution protein T [Azotobacter vinelandii CA]|uniref:Tn4652, cointegrate resolution protein T n=2 Tax=Azotobacter vinelandii TaxID=354 RepID=C1DIR8_AZOVD|nr:DNA-binding protein [Azotobacter vinelandii]ACO78749.1 Tn4652, cointegrate resolution protein T [Azotobacter vinelandii DJ]AGK16631.1 cointegrate resolution protein T [Azotobacter vinelandii CA]AGK20714.1 cointegrate resolution protein T [Azotobacter vinelandii CA6]SFX33255.1 replication region DNA-binding N-term [Azotobacter vinelandii]GLK60138.1 integrase [Azotobacter vinelandii]